MQDQISWQKPSEHRTFGRFMGYTPDGKVRVRHGSKELELLPSEITWEDE